MSDNGLICSSDGTILLLCSDKDLSSVVIPDSVISIADNAFMGCDELITVIFPRSLTSIGDNAFRGCTSLESVDLPDSVTSIGKSAFRDCTSLESVDLPDSIEYLERMAFRGCTTLQSIDLPDSITCVKKSLLSGCTSLSSVSIPKSVTSIEEFAFNECRSIESIDIPDFVVSIGDNAFSDCESLEVITIPDSVSRLGSQVFFGCSKLETAFISISLEYRYNTFPKGCKVKRQSNCTVIGPETTITGDPIRTFFGSDVKKEIDKLNQKLNEYCDKLEELDNGLSSQSETLEHIQEEVQSKMESLRNEVDSSVSESENSCSEKLETAEKILSDADKKVHDFFKDKEQLWDEHMSSAEGRLSSVSNSLESDLKKILENAVEEIVTKTNQTILDSFNSALAELGAEYRENLNEAIKQLLQPKQLAEAIKAGSSVKYKHKHKRYNILKSCVKSGIIPFIVGPAGTGKSTAAEQLADDLHLNFYSANRVQNTFELTGFVNAAGEYVPTQFYNAFTKGGLFFFDEVDASSPEALVTINTATSQRYMTFPGQNAPVRAHSNFVVICAGNTFGTGSTAEYTGRNRLDAATLDRFMIIDWPYDEELERASIKDDDLLEISWKLREICDELKLKVIISTRGIVTVGRLIDYHQQNDLSFDRNEMIFKKFLRSVSPKDLASIKNKLDECSDSDEIISDFTEYLDRI